MSEQFELKGAVLNKHCVSEQNTMFSSCTRNLTAKFDSEDIGFEDGSLESALVSGMSWDVSTKLQFADDRSKSQCQTSSFLLGQVSL